VLSGCVSWRYLGSRPPSECQIAPPERLESDRETALKISADLTTLINAPIKADFEKVFKDKATQTFRAIPDTSAACYMLLKAITCMSERPSATAMAERLFDYLKQTNACELTDTSPIASIELNSAKACVREVLGNTNKSWNVYYCQVQIRNASPRSTIQVTHVKLTDLQYLVGDDFKPWPNVVEEAFIEWPPDKPREISPGEKVSVPFARIFPPDLQREFGDDQRFSGNVDAPQFRFLIQGWHKVMTSHLDPGTHRFKLAVFFKNAPPAEARLELEWPEKQREGVDSIVNGLKIRKLQD
jgi:hypothetical protein